MCKSAFWRSPRRLYAAGSVALLLASTVCALAQTPPPSAGDDSHVHATLRLTSGATQYRPGELIQLQLQFVSDDPQRFTVSSEVENRWGTVAMEEFHLKPRNLAADPLALYAKPFLYNERRFSPVHSSFSAAALPTPVNLPLTDWLRFDHRGHYKLSLRTSRVYALPATPGGPQRRLPLDTNEVEFDILPSDPAWQAQQLKEIESQTPINFARLRALGTADAARFLARHYRGDADSLDRETLLGLLGSPNRQAGVDEMRRLLYDPDFPVTPSFISALAIMATPPLEAQWSSIRATQSALRQQLADALPAKHGRALVTSRQTYLAGLQ